MKLSIAAAVFSLCIQFTSAQKILIFNPAGSRSQVIWNARIADTLAEAGMDV
ncbi:hypothetical protein AAVH_33284, partial [Aphelenchoides avenae]